MLKKAFTLAEIIIVFGVLGLVAEMTIPALITQHDKIVQVAQLKKFYSVFSQGMLMTMKNNGCNDMLCTGLFDSDSSNATWQNNMIAAMSETFKITKTCPKTDDTCKKLVTYLGSTFNQRWAFDTGYNFQTLDNFFFGIIDNDSANCTYFPAGAPSKLANFCGGIEVDINGSKGPNRSGRDYFIFYVGRDGALYPYMGAEYAKAEIGSSDYTNSSYWWSSAVSSPGQLCGYPTNSTIPSNAHGLACAARIMEEGWQMNY